MKKIYKFNIKFSVLFLLFIFYLNSCESVKYPSNISNSNVPTNDFSGWNTFNKENMGISFKLPETWQYINDSNALNNQGEVMSTIINLKDLRNDSFCAIEYHYPPYGKELYKFVEEQFNNSEFKKEMIDEAGIKAMKTTSVATSDIKGNVYDPPLEILQIDMKDNSGDGFYHIYFKVPVKN